MYNLDQLILITRCGLTRRTDLSRFHNYVQQTRLRQKKQNSKLNSSVLFECLTNTTERSQKGTVERLTLIAIALFFGCTDATHCAMLSQRLNTPHHTPYRLVSAGIGGYRPHATNGTRSHQPAQSHMPFFLSPVPTGGVYHKATPHPAIEARPASTAGAAG